MNLGQLAEAIWKEGFFDITSLRRQRQLLEVVAETTDRAPNQVDFDGTMCVLSYVGQEFTERQLSFRFSRIGGSARIIIDLGGDDVSARFQDVTATPVMIRKAVEWLDEKKPEVKKPRTKKGKSNDPGK